MRGARYGTVEKCGTVFVHVRVDRLNRVVRIAPTNLLHEGGG